MSAYRPQAVIESETSHEETLHPLRMVWISVANPGGAGRANEYRPRSLQLSFSYVPISTALANT